MDLNLRDLIHFKVVCNNLPLWYFLRKFPKETHSDWVSENFGPDALFSKITVALSLWYKLFLLKNSSQERYHSLMFFAIDFPPTLQAMRHRGRVGRLSLIIGGLWRPRVRNCFWFTDNKYFWRFWGACSSARRTGKVEMHTQTFYTKITRGNGRNCKNNSPVIIYFPPEYTPNKGGWLNFLPFHTLTGMLFRKSNVLNPFSATICCRNYPAVYGLGYCTFKWTTTRSVWRALPTFS